MNRSEVWTSYRKLMANLVPALFFVPVFAAGLMLYQRGLQSWAIVCMGVSLIVGVLAVNRFGLFQNAQMMREMQQLLGRVPVTELFVGLGRPGSVGILDPHDDLGWLIVHPEKLEFIGEKGRYEIGKGEVIGVRYRPNVHSVLRLGRWVSVEAKRGGKPLRMLIEPRNRPTHLQNRAESARLFSALQEWLK